MEYSVHYFNFISKYLNLNKKRIRFSILFLTLSALLLFVGLYFKVEVIFKISIILSFLSVTNLIAVIIIFYMEKDWCRVRLGVVNKNEFNDDWRKIKKMNFKIK